MPVTVKIKGAEQEFAKANSDLNQFVNSAMRARAFQALGDLKSVTPVDTGRARNSWTLTTSPTEFRSTLVATNALSTTLLSPPSKDTIEKLYITNGVSYIDKLNAGSSKQAPSRFIENTIQKYFEIEGLVYLEV